VNGDDEGAEGGRKRDTKAMFINIFFIFFGELFFSITRSFIASINGNFAFSFLSTKNGKRKENKNSRRMVSENISERGEEDCRASQ
jgi:formate hydrogenlyase subunit 3/multisubunit Na+/H+ antiporter MnhD subunit